MTDDDLIDLIDDEPGSGSDSAPVLPPWKILVVDDDEEVHAATRYALAGILILGRPLALLHAHSAAEARRMLMDLRDVAVVLLDVVMESNHAGLDLVGTIRESMGLTECRIILRTGQPGYAPELEVFNQYDINDYRTKSELTQIRLITSLTAALRSFDQIRTIAQSRKGLELIVHAAADLIRNDSVGTFAEGVLTQIAALLRLPLDGIMCIQQGALNDTDDPQQWYVLGASGHLAHYMAHPLTDVQERSIRHALEQAMAARSHLFTPEATILYLHSQGHPALVYLATSEPITTTDRQLLEVFAANLSACYANLQLVNRLNQAAYRDSLTGLLSRAGLLKEIEIACAVIGEPEVLVFADIAHFSDTNDALGHDVGNLLLQAVAIRLDQRFGKCARVARVATDVFAIMGPESLNLPGEVLKTFDESFSVDIHELPVAVHVGICRVEDCRGAGVRLFKRASIALNRAKRSAGDPVAYFKSSMEDDTRSRLDIIHKLRNDFSANKLELWFQPQIHLETGRVGGFEGLLRWPDGQGGFVHGPGDFIPMAEYSGLILDIGDWVIDRSCAFIRRLSEAGWEQLVVAANVSLPQFRHRNFISHVQTCLQQHQIAPAQLELEITESIAMDEPMTFEATLKTLKNLGVKVAMDDFGTGYSSLGYLQRLPIDRLKIDRQFILELTTEKGRTLAETIVTLGHKLGLSVLAEGVETPDQIDYLRSMGCERAQGFFYAKAMPADEALRWLTEHRQSAG